jgi:hypothetical protein
MKPLERNPQCKSEYTEKVTSINDLSKVKEEEANPGGGGG